MFEEVFIDGINSPYSSMNECLKSNLVDDPGQASCQVKDHLDGIIGKEFFRPFGPFQVKLDIASGIIDGEASEVMREDDTLFEGFILGLFEAGGESLSAGEDKGETVL